MGTELWQPETEVVEMWERAEKVMHQEGAIWYNVGTWVAEVTHHQSDPMPMEVNERTPIDFNEPLDLSPLDCLNSSQVLKKSRCTISSLLFHTKGS